MLLKEKGISDYYIFLEEATGILFASYTINNPTDHLSLSNNEKMVVVYERFNGYKH